MDFDLLRWETYRWGRMLSESAAPNHPSVKHDVAVLSWASIPVKTNMVFTKY